MGTFGTGILENDEALDTYFSYKEKFEKGLPPEKIKLELFKLETDEGLPELEDNSNFWLGLAKAQLDHDTLDIDIINAISEIVEDGIDLDVWEEESKKLLNERKGVLSDFLSEVLEKYKFHKKQKLTKAISDLKTIKTVKNFFLLQSGHPIIDFQIENQFSQLVEIFPKLFSPNTEFAFLLWHNIPIRFHYNYELYANFDNLLIWLEKLAFEKKGQYDFVLSTDVFLTTIQSNWDNGKLIIRSDWSAKRSHSNLAEILNKKGPINISVLDFLREWKIILYQILNSIKKTGVIITEPEEKEKIQRLNRIVNEIQGQGILYTKK
jgi:hypothetical protein